MADQPAQDPIDKFLSEEHQLESRRQELIKKLLHEKEAAMKAFDEKLAKLGHNGATPRRNHHRKVSDKQEPKAQA